MRKILLISALLLLSMFVIACGGPECGNSICEPGENAATCEDCPSCDDDNACTKDSFNFEIYECQNIIQKPCCGNEICEEVESFATCSTDCPLQILPESATHQVVPFYGQTGPQYEVTAQLKSAEKNYLDATTYVHIPGDDPTNTNALDNVTISFTVPENGLEVLEEKNFTLELSLACGNFGVLNIQAFNKFGGYDVIDTVRCNEVNWQEKQLSYVHPAISGDKATIILTKEAGRGEIKIDKVSLQLQ